MNKLTRNKIVAQSFFHVLTVMIAFTLFVTASHAQTGGGTVISNQASAAYSDGNGNNFSTVSNTVTVTVANVAGLTITPDAGTHASVVTGQTGVPFVFRITNTGNFTDQVRFLASGASIQATGATVTGAVIDVDNSGTVNTGDTNIFSNGADVLSASIAKNGYIDVIVTATITGAAGSTVNIQLGDATGASPYDNQATSGSPSAHEVRTVATTSVNGLREARGDINATVDNDAQVRLNVTYPTGPVALGSNISYGWEVCNTGARPAQSITLTGAPSGSNTGVFIFAPVPVGTSLASTQSPAFPAGTLYTTSPLSIAPTAATWTTTAPGTLSTVTRVAFNVGATVANGACTTPINMAVTVTTPDATNNIYEIGDVVASNTVNAQITDQSGDTVSNKGDGNANFDEPATGDPVSPTQGFKVITSLVKTGSALIGPSAQPAAVGPTDNNDDYTNRSVTTGINVAPGNNTNAGGTVIFTNTIKNTGNATDTFTITLPTVPTGFTAQISTDGGTTYVNSGTVTLAKDATTNILVKVVAPSGQPVLTGYDTVVRVTSANTTTAKNDTINRLYTGALELTKTATVINGTGVGGATDPVPGAVIEYTITYKNITTNSGANNGTFTVSNLVITEDGNATPNNWAVTTKQVTTTAPVDSNGGTVTGNTAGAPTVFTTTIAADASALKDTIPTIAPQATGTFKFRRTIN